MSYHSHLDREWDAMGWPKEGQDPQAWIYRQLKELLEVFSKGGHSGSSAPYVASLFKTLALHKPLGPLTGIDSEWNELWTTHGRPGHEPRYQNNRCSHVFKESNGRAYDDQGKIFENEDGSRFTNADSRVDITFPYTQETEIVELKHALVKLAEQAE